MDTTDADDMDRCDLLVIGSGAAGLSAAIVARKHGLRVLVLEKEPKLGGTTAVSGGWAWVPVSSVSARSGAVDTVEAATRYLRHEAGERFSVRHVAAYLEHAPRMIDYLEREGAVRFMASPSFPDYHPDAPGAADGRSIVAQPFDARELGSSLQLLRLPLRETTLFGLNVGSGTELGHFFRATRSLESAVYVARRIAGHALDVLRYGRGMRLSNGNALAARLLKTALESGVEIIPSAPVRELVVENGSVTGAIVELDGTRRRVSSRRGVVLACGGFSHDVVRRRSLFRHAPTGREHESPVPTANTGDGLRLGESAGGVVEDGLPNGAAWMPVSILKRHDGTRAVFPHVVDRAKPGVIAVTQRGTRFVNESNSYHDFGQAMIDATRADVEPRAFLVCDRRAIRRYGLGFVKPFPFPLRPQLDSGYLLRGRTLVELAERAGNDAAALERTVREFNEDAREARDSRFGKGSTRYNRFQGDAWHGPNPCLASLEEPPFYAVRLVVGDIGTFAGLRADEFARVINRDGRPVPGLYVAGNDMCSIMGGSYPGAGINIGPAMTFGYIAALHAAGKLERSAVQTGPSEAVARLA
jgi:succinate dehydrogenase/fumarate reductase flavoprotein subunit